jgi:murein DD-endopeptidase MepM/ murein hydrolase activator NlpD
MMPFYLMAFPVLRGSSEISFEDGFLYPRADMVHHAIDIIGTPGMTIVSPVIGRVVTRCRLGGERRSGAGTSPRGGNYIVVVDLLGNFHYFAHMQAPSPLQPGAVVVAGGRIGLLGDSGIARGNPHLHYQVWGPFTHEGAAQEYASGEFVYRFSNPINPYSELVKWAAILGATHNAGGRYTIPATGAAAAGT